MFRLHDKPQSTAKRLRRSAGGVSFIEALIVVIVLGFVGALVLPQFSDAAHASRQNTLKDDLRYLRTQIAVFRAQHRNLPPGHPDGNPSAAPNAESFLQQMTSMTDDRCRTGGPASQRRLGPYLEAMPANAMNGLTSVKIIGNGEAMPAPDGSTGWIYKPRTMEIIPNLAGKDEHGTRYIDY